MKGTGAKRNVCPGSCVSTGAKFPVAPVESAPMNFRTFCRTLKQWNNNSQIFHFRLTAEMSDYYHDIQHLIPRRGVALYTS